MFFPVCALFRQRFVSFFRKNAQIRANVFQLSVHFSIHFLSFLSWDKKLVATMR